MLADVRRTCEIYTRSIELGENEREVVTQLATWFGIQRPAIYKRLRKGGALPPYRHGATGRNAAGIRRRKDIILPPPVPCRDPCPRCGVRRDFGCKHSLAPLGMML